MTNDLIEALRQKRAEGGSTTTTGPRAEYSKTVGLEAKIDAITEKLDRILECVEQGPGSKKEESNGTGTSDPGKY